jgi:hypothetical protein
MRQQPVDVKDASVEIAGYLKDLMNPPPGGAPLGSILGAYIFKRILQDAGYAVVPAYPSAEVRAAFKDGLFRPFEKRYASMLEAAWPQDPPSNQE